MDLSRYRELLGRFHYMVLACGGQPSIVSARWIADFDRSFTHTIDNQELMRHLDQILRSANALSIMADGQIGTESRPLAKGLLDSPTSALLFEVNQLRDQLLLAKRVLNDPGIQGLVGQFLSSVVFVMDYVQFDFNGSSLTTFVWPEWRQGNERIREAEPGYRDALCRLIGTYITGVEESAECLSIHFTDGSTLAASLRTEDASGPENATFISETGLLWIW